MGHSHVPLFFVEDAEKRIEVTATPPLRLRQGFRYIVNVGSVGQPRDGNPDACYLLFDDQEGLLRLERVPYDLLRTQRKMAAAGLPQYLIARLAWGR